MSGLQCYIISCCGKVYEKNELSKAEKRANGSSVYTDYNDLV